MPTPSPTQAENDAAAMGLHVMDKDYDRSGFDVGAIPPDTLPPEPPVTEPPLEPGQPPMISSLQPTSSNPPNVTLTVNGSNFTKNSVIVFDGQERSTSYRSGVKLTAQLQGFSAGAYPVLVRDVGGDSNIVTFTFDEVLRTAPAPAPRAPTPTPAPARARHPRDADD